MYEPSEELIEQIAQEFQNRKPLDYPLTDAEAYIKTDICVQLPTIRKALELYENQPQWQDKPDKEGWYGVCVLTNDGKWFWLCSPQEPIGAYRRDGYMYIYYEDTEFPLSEFLKRYADYEGIKWLYIPEPKPYKGED